MSAGISLDKCFNVSRYLKARRFVEGLRLALGARFVRMKAFPH